MESSQQMYSEDEKKLFYGQIQGQEELGGVKAPIANYSVKIRESLLLKGIDIAANYIRYVIWNGTVNDDIWSAVVELLLKEKQKRIVAVQNKAELLTA